MVIINERHVSSDKVLDVYTCGARFETGLDTDYSDAFHAFLRSPMKMTALCLKLDHICFLQQLSPVHHPNILQYKVALDARMT
jgi:hypothetical protein